MAPTAASRKREAVAVRAGAQGVVVCLLVDAIFIVLYLLT